MRDVLSRVQKTTPTFSTIGATPVPFENFFGLWKKTSDNPKKTFISVDLHHYWQSEVHNDAIVAVLFY